MYGSIGSQLNGHKTNFAEILITFLLWRRTYGSCLTTSLRQMWQCMVTTITFNLQLVIHTSVINLMPTMTLLLPWLWLHILCCIPKEFTVPTWYAVMAITASISLQGPWLPLHHRLQWLDCPFTAVRTLADPLSHAACMQWLWLPIHYYEGYGCPCIACFSSYRCVRFYNCCSGTLLLLHTILQSFTYGWFYLTV